MAWQKYSVIKWINIQEKICPRVPFSIGLSNIYLCCVSQVNVPIPGLVYEIVYVTVIFFLFLQMKYSDPNVEKGLEDNSYSQIVPGIDYCIAFQL